MPKRSLRPVLALALALAVLPLATSDAQAAARAHASSRFLTGIGDEEAQMFTDPLWQQLHTRIARYIAPYDAVVHPDSLARARAWIEAAEAQHVKILVAFYHSEHSPTVLPSVASYKRDVQKFVRLFPNVRQYQSWDEANRGNVRGYFSSPSARAAAAYYQALIRVCKRCTAIGLDVLDQQNISSTLRYISEFRSAIGRLRTVMPKIWGLHDYSDVNRFESWRTRHIVRALRGQVWLTETGGIVKFGGAFPNVRGRGLARAGRVVTYTMRLAFALARRVKRIYLYNWTGGTASSRFDAGLTDAHYRPRAGYVALCRVLHAKRCNLAVSWR
jgi:polysaccharide biosynthesis protein PslG